MTLTVSVRPGAEPETGSIAARWRAEDIVARIWARDATVWGDPEVSEIANRLGWLDSPRTSRQLIEQITELHETALSEGVTDIVLCGMGGSSLAPEVFSATLPAAKGSPKLTLMDSTHPDAIRAVTDRTDPRTTWYIVASKSGGTLETLSLYNHFWETASGVLENPGRHFVAITDSGTSLESLSTERGFRSTVLADSEVGGRYSALTAFGLVPAALMGADVLAILETALAGADRCQPDTPLDENPGFRIGALLASRALTGADKAQFIATDTVHGIGIWIEQLIAESTGKQGAGIVPIDGGPLINGSPDATIVAIGSEPMAGADINIAVDEPYDVGALMFVLEFATAVAGEILGINPFDQPDVEMAKKLTERAMAGGLASADMPPTSASGGRWLESLATATQRARPSYVSIQAYIPQTPDNTGALEALRTSVTEAIGAYTTVGFGPRFLHSTGQLHKGGPSGAVYLQIVGDTGDILGIPDSSYSFNELITAQSRGDRAALRERNRTVIAIDLGGAGAPELEAMAERLRGMVSR